MYSERFKQLRAKLRISQQEMAEILGLSPSMIGLIETNKREPKEYLLTAIETRFNVDSRWLREGVGDMGDVSLPEDRHPKSRAGYRIGARIAEVLRAFDIGISDLAEASDITDEHAVELLENRRLADNSTIERIAGGMHVNPLWLATGAGAMDQDDKSLRRSDSWPGVSDQPLDYSPTEPLLTQENMAKVFTMVAQVLNSKTHYADSLDKNIFSFYSAVKKEEALTQRLNEQDRRIAELERIVKELRAGKDDNPLDFQGSEPFTRIRPKGPKKS
jgi:DNA-binding XRE family transcriptional regulator